MFSTKGRYALRVLIDIAENSKNDYVALKDIAKRQNISKKYLESIMKKLVDNKLLLGISGKNGGYKLVKSASKYSIGEILEATEGTIAPVFCLSNKTNKCTRKNYCKILPLWIELNELNRKFLYKKKLSELIK